MMAQRLLEGLWCRYRGGGTPNNVKAVWEVAVAAMPWLGPRDGSTPPPEDVEGMVAALAFGVASGHVFTDQDVNRFLEVADVVATWTLPPVARLRGATQLLQAAETAAAADNTLGAAAGAAALWRCLQAWGVAPSSDTWPARAAVLLKHGAAAAGASPALVCRLQGVVTEVAAVAVK
jgi:hypothetical protein